MSDYTEKVGALFKEDASDIIQWKDFSVIVQYSSSME